MFDAFSMLGAAGLGYLGQRSANRASQAMSREQMAFQERMRATQYQTAMSDMSAAGLNPILAYRQGGAGTPSGASSSQLNELSGGVASALEFRRANAEVANLRVQNDKLKAETLLASASAASISAGLPEKEMKSVFYSAARDVARAGSDFVRPIIADKVNQFKSSGREIQDIRNKYFKDKIHYFD